MKNIAFRRARNTQAKGRMHDKFIVEYADTSLFTYGFHKKEDGWEFMAEDKFEKELEKNNKWVDEFQNNEKKELDKQRAKALKKIPELLKQKEEQEKLMKEFEEFKAWKASQK